MPIPRSKSLVLAGPRLPRHDPAPIRERLDLISLFAVFGMACDIYDIELPSPVREVCDLAALANRQRMMNETMDAVVSGTQL